MTVLKCHYFQNGRAFAVESENVMSCCLWGLFAVCFMLLLNAKVKVESVCVFTSM